MLLRTPLFKKRIEYIKEILREGAGKTVDFRTIGNNTSQGDWTNEFCLNIQLRIMSLRSQRHVGTPYVVIRGDRSLVLFPARL